MFIDLRPLEVVILGMWKVKGLKELLDPCKVLLIKESMSMRYYYKLVWISDNDMKESIRYAMERL